MNDRPLRTHSDPYATLASLTAAAFSLAPTARREPPLAGSAENRRGSLLERLDRWLWSSRQRDLERALASATDVVEVEVRLRDRERKLLQRYY